METNTAQVYAPQGTTIRAAASKAGRFLWHLLQMVIAMEAGMVVYHVLLSPVLRATPYGALTDAYPMIGYWGMVVSMALGMLALMIYRKASGRYCVEMTAVMIAPVAALTVLVLCSLLPNHALYAAGDVLMILAMAAFMLYRPHEHGHGGHEHAAHQHVDPASTAGEQEPNCHQA